MLGKSGEPDTTWGFLPNRLMMLNIHQIHLCAAFPWARANHRMPLYPVLHKSLTVLASKNPTFADMNVLPPTQEDQMKQENTSKSAILRCASAMPLRWFSTGLAQATARQQHQPGRGQALAAKAFQRYVGGITGQRSGQ